MNLSYCKGLKKEIRQVRPALTLIYFQTEF